MKILCINIDSDTESWRLSQKEFDRVGLSVERVPAVVEDNRPLAFNKSVYKAMGMAKGDDLLLMEDDVVFDCNDPMEKLLIALKSMNHRPQSIHLGANIIGMDTTVWQMPTPRNRNVSVLWNCWQSHCTYYSADCVERVLETFPYVTDEYKTEGLVIFDEWFRCNILPMGLSYVLRPMIAYQRPRRSEIWNCHADYTSVHRRGNEYLNTL